MTTPKEFDYDLWTTEDGKCYMRVKRTGEQCEINRETMRLLQSEAKRIQRDKAGIPVYGMKDGRYVILDRTALLSLEDSADDYSKHCEWTVVPSYIEENEIIASLEQAFRATLTKKQTAIYQSCLLGGMSASEYGRQQNISEGAVRKSINLIRKKAETFFA